MKKSAKREGVISMKRRISLPLIILLFILGISGCAHVISRESRDMAAQNIPFQWIAENPERYRGILVIWGGEIIETRNIQEGTIIEVLQRPLGYSEEPDETQGSGGRFLVSYDRGFLNPVVLRRGMKITVAGMVEGEKQIGVDGTDYSYPVLVAREIHLWNEHGMMDWHQQPWYQYPSYPYPYY